MGIAEQAKIEIQTFVYFLFRGTLDPRLIDYKFNYLDHLLGRRQELYNCFEIFAYYSQQAGALAPQSIVADYILELIENKKTKTDLNEISAYNANSRSYWKDFLKLSKCFCHNQFPIPVENFDLTELNGNGTDAVPFFAVWTNVVEIGGNGTVINSDYALIRANERLKLWDNVQLAKPFDSWELEQELY